VHSGVAWRIGLNRPRAAAMRPSLKFIRVDHLFTAVIEDAQMRIGRWQLLQGFIGQVLETSRVLVAATLD